MTMQAQFEKERDKTLSELPDNIKSMFGQIGFALCDEDDIWSGEWLPVLILSPFSVPPRPFRDIYWAEKFAKGKRAKNLESLDYLVYHYSASEENIDDCYSFVEQVHFEPYESGKEKGYDEIPLAIQEKLSAHSPLTAEEEDRVRGIQHMLEDIAKDPHDRKRGLFVFKERHEVEAEKKMSAADAGKKRKRG